MKKEELSREINLFLILAILFILVFLFLRPTITGFVTYTPFYHNWTFQDPNNYSYDGNLILIENNSAQLKLQEEIYNWTTTNSSGFYIVTAYYDGSDKTEEVIDLDDKDLAIEKNKTLDIIFEDDIKNNDIITLYLEKEKISEVYLCNSSICEENYGILYFPNTEGWYNITVENLPAPTNNLVIIADIKTKINYIKVLREIEEIHYGTNYIYPESSTLETFNLALPAINNLNFFSKNEELNQQQINYYYSTDNGQNWDLIPSNGSLSSNLEQIKIKAEFSSNTMNTPILYDMSLSYQYCIENWECTNWTECYENNTKSRICNDTNECNTFENKPTEIENCTYSSEPSEEISSSTSSSGGGGGTGGSRTFTRPIEKTATEETIEEKTETKKETQEITPKTEPTKVEQKNPLDKFTGFVSYNLGEEGIDIIGLSIFTLIVIFLIKKSNKKKD